MAVQRKVVLRRNPHEQVSIGKKLNTTSLLYIQEQTPWPWDMLAIRALHQFQGGFV